jgi:VCBS repeat-containing protein
MTRIHIVAFPCIVFALALAGCAGGGSSTPMQSSSGAGAQSQSLSTSQQSEVVASTADAIGDGVETGLGGAAQSISQRSAQSLNPCISPSPNPPVIDADGIPANETYTFNDCTNLGWAQNEIVNGQINLTDTSPNGGAVTLSYTQTNTNLSRTGTDANDDAYTALLNGTRNPALSNNILSVTRAMQVQRTSTAHGTSTITQNWQWTFTPASGATVQLLHALPAGQFAGSSGTITYVNGSTNATVAFSIATPLVYDPGCATPPRIDSGVVSFTVNGNNNHNGSFTATFPGCGQKPVITNS